ncbi:MAG: ECF-type sigma factor [Gemmatimonadota bacterium]
MLAPDPKSNLPTPPAAPDATPVTTDAFFALLYRELHQLAERQLRRQGSGVTLGATTLLHELYLNLADRTKAQFPDRPRFLGYASRAMRGLIIDYARRRKATKRGGEFQLLPLEEERAQEQASEGTDLEELGDAIDQLATVDPRLAELVDLHFFCGLTFTEIASLRDVSLRTVLRDWRKARMVLHRELRKSGPDDAEDPEVS